jgi:hypothetical protein
MENLTSPKKNFRCAVAVNILTQVDPQIYNSHNQLWYRIGKHFPEAKFFQYTPGRTTIDNCRNFAAKFALEQECHYVMFVDDDMILHEMTFQSLVENIQRPNVDVVMALTYIRGYPFHPMCFIDRNREEKEITSLDFYDDFEEHIDSETHMVEVDAIGCACVLIKTELIKKLEPPYFMTTPHHTEDVYFCMKAKRTLGRNNVGIYVDCGVPTAHMGEKPAYSHLNVKYYRQLEESMDPNLIKYKNLKGKQLPGGDRGDDYLKMIGEQVENELPAIMRNEVNI